jgi:polysaccharide biosynthesis protein PslH
MTRHRILFLTPQLPFPPEQGTALRNLNLLCEVAKRHEVSLLSFAEQNTPMPEVLTSCCEQVRTVPVPKRTHRQRLRTLWRSSLPDMAHRLESMAFATELEALEPRGFDIVQIEGIELARYGLLLRERYGREAPALVFDDHNAEYVLQRRAFETDIRRPRRWHVAAYSFVQWQRLRRFERTICRQADGVIAASEADAAALRALCPGVDPLVAPNGVDVLRYHPDLPDTLPLAHPAVVFTGKMDYRPNVDAMLWFGRAIWPRIHAERPDATLYIVGKSPHPRLETLRETAGIVITGYVPDILPYFGGADVYVVPMRIGGGTRLKILEAMSAGLALVTTTLGIEGIQAVAGEHALIADEPAAFSTAILELLDDKKRRRSLGTAARGLALNEYDWRCIVPRLEPMYTRIARTR